MSKKRRKKFKVTEVSILPIVPTSKGIVAFCNFILNGDFKICDCAIATDLTNGGYRVIYPIKRIPPHNKSVQVFYPLHKNIAEEIGSQIIDEFLKLTKEKNNG